MRKMRTTTLNHHDFVGAIITGYYSPPKNPPIASPA